MSVTTFSFLVTFGTGYDPEARAAWYYLQVRADLQNEGGCNQVLQASDLTCSPHRVHCNYG